MGRAVPRQRKWSRWLLHNSPPLQMHEGDDDDDDDDNDDDHDHDNDDHDDEGGDDDLGESLSTFKSWKCALKRARLMPRSHTHFQGCLGLQKIKWSVVVCIFVTQPDVISRAFSTFDHPSTDQDK